MSKREKRNGISPSMLVNQANLIGNQSNVFCNYVRAGGTFIYKFYRRIAGNDYPIYLGSTQLPHTVIDRMRKYCGGQS